MGTRNSSSPFRSGSRPRKQALLILDMISEFDFEDGTAILRCARRIVPAIAKLKARAKAAGVPTVYVNDTAGKWESDQTAFVQRCLSAQARGADVVKQLEPLPGDFFIFKPKHSGFYATPLSELLCMLKVGELILTGITSHQCVLFTGTDAYVRDFSLTVPVDCIAAPEAAQTRHALFILEQSLRARTPRSTSVRLSRK